MSKTQQIEQKFQMAKALQEAISVSNRKKVDEILEFVKTNELAENFISMSIIQTTVELRNSMASYNILNQIFKIANIHPITEKSNRAELTNLIIQIFANTYSSKGLDIVIELLYLTKGRDGLTTEVYPEGLIDIATQILAFAISTDSIEKVNKVLEFARTKKITENFISKNILKDAIDQKDPEILSQLFKEIEMNVITKQSYPEDLLYLAIDTDNTEIVKKTLEFTDRNKLTKELISYEVDLTLDVLTNASFTKNLEIFPLIFNSISKINGNTKISNPIAMNYRLEASSAFTNDELKILLGYFTSEERKLLVLGASESDKKTFAKIMNDQEFQKIAARIKEGMSFKDSSTMTIFDNLFTNIDCEKNIFQDIIFEFNTDLGGEL
jgi:hypothetical protein